jgi:hypothetical protein
MSVFHRSWFKIGLAAVLLAASLIVVLAGCGGAAGTKSTGTAKSTATPSSTGTAKSTSTQSNKNTGGLTSIEAPKLVWPDVSKGFGGDAVLWRLAPVKDKNSTTMMLDPNWQHNDRSAAWFLWYADPAGEDWFLIGISGTKVAYKDIGTRGSAMTMDSSWPRQCTAFSMKDAAAAAAKQGANLDAVTWVEFNCDYPASDFRRKPSWVFACSETLANGGTLDYRMFVNAMTGAVAGALNVRDEKMALPIDRQALQATRAVNHQADLEQFFSFISKGDAVTAVRQLAYQAAPNEATANMWLANFQSIKSLKVVSIEQANLEQWTDEWESYKVTLDIATSEPPDKYGWENGRNVRWVTLIPQGGGSWKVAELAQSP